MAPQRVSSSEKGSPLVQENSTWVLRPKCPGSRSAVKVPWWSFVGCAGSLFQRCAWPSRHTQVHLEVFWSEAW